MKSLEKHSTLSVQWNLPNDVQLSVANQKNGRLAYLPEKKSVLLAQAERADSGAYGCYASNEAGFVTFVWQINVQGKPTSLLLVVKFMISLNSYQVP